MKKTLLFSLLLPLLAMVSCNDEFPILDPTDPDKGSIEIKATVSEWMETRAWAYDVDFTAATVVLTGPGTASNTMNWPANGIISGLVPGDYTVKIVSHPDGIPAPNFDDPAYEGVSGTVKVNAGRRSTANVNCNFLVGALYFEYDPSLAGLDVVPNVEIEDGSLEYVAAHKNDKGFFAPGAANVTIEVGGYAATIEGEDSAEITLTAGKLSKMLLKEVVATHGGINVVVEFTPIQEDEKTVVVEEVPAVKVEFTDLNMLALTVDMTPGRLCSKYSAVSVSKMVWNETFTDGTVEGKIEAMEMMIEFGMFPVFDAAVEEVYYINGYADYENLFIYLIYDLDGNIYEYKEIEYVSPSIDPTLSKPGAVTITRGETTATTVTFSFATGENTLGFYAYLVSKEDYLDLLAAKDKDGNDIGEEMLKDYAAMYGAVSLKAADTFDYSGTTGGVDYVMCAIPMNANGASHEYGYGDIYTHEYTAPGTRGTSKANNPQSVPSYRNTLVGKRFVPVR